jgi:hypothetical protein
VANAKVSLILTNFTKYNMDNEANENLRTEQLQEWNDMQAVEVEIWTE